MGKKNNGSNEEWLKLCDYVHKEILLYSKDMKFPKSLALRLRGLSKGQFIANNKIKPMANYTIEDILLTFKINKLDILNSTSDKFKFKDEKHRINYIMVIVENKINDVVLKRQKLRKENEIVKDVEVQEKSKAEYIKKSKSIKNEKLKSLW